MRNPLLISDFNEDLSKIHRLITILLYFRCILCILKLYYTIPESCLELLSIYIIYTAFTEENPYRCTLYTAFALIEILYTWTELIRKLQNPYILNTFSFQGVYSLIIANISVILYIITIYFVYAGYQIIMVLQLPAQGILIGSSYTENSKEIHKKQPIIGISMLPPQIKENCDKEKSPAAAILPISQQIK